MSRSPLSIVEDEVRELVRRQGLDPTRDGPGLLASLVDEVIGEYETRTQASSLPRIDDRDSLKRHVLDRVAGLGPLQPLLDDPDVEEIWINGQIGRAHV